MAVLLGAEPATLAALVSPEGAPLLLEPPGWESAPGPEPVRPGTACAEDVVAGAPEDAADGAPASMSRPVPSRDFRTVGMVPSMTVSLVPTELPKVYDTPVLVPGAELVW